MIGPWASTSARWRIQRRQVADKSGRRPGATDAQLLEDARSPPGSGSRGSQQNLGRDVLSQDFWAHHFDALPLQVLKKRKVVLPLAIIPLAARELSDKILDLLDKFCFWRRRHRKFFQCAHRVFLNFVYTDH